MGVYELLVGMAAATNSESDPMIKSMIQRAQYWTVVSWLTYPVVYIFPMIGFAGSHAVVAIQVGYCVSDIISKCGVGIVILCHRCQVQEWQGGCFVAMKLSGIA